MQIPTVGAISPAPTESFEFTLNGERVRVAGLPATTTLLDWLRRAGLTGTKCGCAEGDCGACTVALVERDVHGKPAYRAINSCIALLPMFADREIVTVEALESGEGATPLAAGPLHPVQRAMVEHYGSQCGYCTPGFVMSLFEAYHRPGLSRPSAINDQLCGNLCRCTGYRPIREAAVSVLHARAAAPPAASDAFTQRLRAALKPLPDLGYVGAGERFFRPTSLPELFAIKNRHADARLVAGATEIGVELNKKLRRFPTLISTEGVPELTRIRATAAEWRIGAAATLTAIEEALAGEFPALAKMLAVFASRQIRNRATLGGNLVTASPIGDSSPVLLTLDASMVLVSTLGERTVPLHEFFTGYRQTQLRPEEILQEIIVPRDAWMKARGLTRRADFQKVSHRRELDISIVAGAFCVDTDADGIVQRARLAYGGVAMMPVRARRAEAAIEGRRLAEVVDTVAGLLRDEFKPIDDVRGSAEYRRGLIVSLWRKFVSGETSLAVDAPVDYRPGVFVGPGPDGAAGSPNRPELQPTRPAQTKAGLPLPALRSSIAGRVVSSLPATTGSESRPHLDSRALYHESAIGHVTGRARYVDDEAQREPMLEVWPVLAPHARARITRRDASEARAMPGIIAVLMGEDVPGHNDVGVSRKDETLFAVEEAKFHGHLVALVVGESVAACRAAAASVKVDYEPLPPILSISEAIAADSFHNPLRVIARGDAVAALGASPRRLGGKFSFGGQEHFYLETHAAWAKCGDDGDIFISSSTQHPSEIQTIVSEVLALPRHKIVVQAPRMGGGFGGKETQGNTPAALVALAALKTGRPVRLQWDRDIDLQITGKRHPFWSKFEVGFADDGRLLAANIDLVSNGGWSLDLSQPVLERAMFHVDNAYFVPALRVTGRAAKTNLVSNTAFRGFGGPQGMLVIEEILDRVARELRLAPEIVRERNLYHGTGETNRTHYGEDVGDNRIPQLWAAAREQAQLAARRQEIAAWNRAHAGVKRGIALTPVKFGISFTLTHYNQAGALVHVYQDGTVQVNHGGTEMGQGLHTKILGIAMRELGLPAAAIRIMRTSTDKVPNTSATAASAGSDLNGAAVRAACATLRERMAPVAAKLMAKARAEGLRRDAKVDIAEPVKAEADLPPIAEADIGFADGLVFARGAAPSLSMSFAQVATQCYAERVSLSATGYYATPGIHWDWKTATGRPFAYFAGGAAVSEVEVDGYTGMMRVRRVDIVHDVGDSLNPGIDRGQIEGGFVQGMGWLTSEELKWDDQGRLLTHSASTYQIPAISDAPMEFNVTLLPNATNAHAIHGSKAVGEPPLMLAISVREAIRDAIASFGPAGGPVPLASPATPEAVWRAVQERQIRS